MNPIPFCGMFATKTLSELQEYIEMMNGKEKAQAYLIMQLTLNTCHALVEDEFVDTLSRP